MREEIGLYLDLTATLAKRTAEMHLALARPDAPGDIRPQPMNAEDLARLSEDLAAHAAIVFDALKSSLSRLPDDAVETAGLALSRRRTLLARFRGLESTVDGNLMKTRIHGDYHLGQILRVGHDYRILDFEGEPARSLEERRARQSPLKDVAGMLRSFSYAAWAAYFSFTTRRPQDAAVLEPWARAWEQANCTVFLQTYVKAVEGSHLIPADDEPLARLLDVFLLDKALYELQYEFNNRPAWVKIPLMGVLALCR
jgi:maltose alpha-D-glucosyltransferase/alpha-amylase